MEKGIEMLIEEIKEKNEKILYQLKPKKFLYILGNPFAYLLGIFWGMFDYNFIKLLFVKTEQGYRFDLQGMPLVIPLFILLHLAPFWYAIFSPLYRWYSWKNINYYITNKKIYIVYKRNFSSIDLKKISEINISIGYLENIFKAGSIDFSFEDVQPSFFGANKKNGRVLKMIDNPYEMFNRIKETKERLENLEKQGFDI